MSHRKDPNRIKVKNESMIKKKERKIARSGVRTHEWLNTEDLKSTPLDQLGHPSSGLLPQQFYFNNILVICSFWIINIYSIILIYNK